MTMVRHIFLKDLRHLRFETGAVVAVAAMSAVFRDVNSTGGSAFLRPDAWTTLFAAVALILIVRLFQSEPVAGADHDWMTRPVSWTDLLTAKAAYVIVFVHIPILASQTVVLARAGFPVDQNLAALLFSFVLSIVLMSLPAAAFALLTPGPGPFLIWGIVLAWLAATVAFDVRAPLPPDVQWMHSTFLVLTMSAAAAVALVRQYRNRNTTRNRLVSAFIVAAGLSVAVHFPYSPILDLQYSSAAERIAASAFPVRVAPERTDSRGDGTLWFPLDAAPSEDGAIARFDWVRMTLAGPGGESFEVEGIATQGFSPDDAFQVVYGVGAALPPSVEDAWRGAPVTLRGRAYLSVFGSPGETTAVLDRDSWTEFGDGIRCRPSVEPPSVEPLEGRIECRRPSGPPLGAMTVMQPPHALTISPAMGGRFSPYPSGLDGSWFWSAYSRWPSARSLASLGDSFEGVPSFDPALPVTVTRREPLGRVYRDFEVTVDLDEYRR